MPKIAFKQVHQKLASQFYGPYQILEKFKPLTHKLQVPEGAHHPMFHMLLLKRYKDDEENDEAQRAELPPFTNTGVVVLEPQTILDNT